MIRTTRFPAAPRAARARQYVSAAINPRSGRGPWKHTMTEPGQIKKAAGRLLSWERAHSSVSCLKANTTFGTKTYTLNQLT